VRAGLSLLALACTGIAPGCGETAPLAGRNVAVILVDALRADRLPFHGAPAEGAPFLAELAGRSVVFERAWAASTWTAPATASIFTGLYPDQHGVIFGFRHHRKMQGRIRLNRIPDEMETLPELMGRAGYRTYGIADNPNVCEEMGFARGFDRLSTTSYAGAETVEGTLASWRDEILGGRSPFFLYLHYMDPHAPYHERQPWYGPAPSAGSDDRLTRYTSELGHVDASLGRVWEMLDLENALVIFVADHGEEFGDHGGWFHGPTLYSELAHVPMLVHLPGGAGPGRRIAANVGALDILATLGELVCGAAATRGDGSSLAPALLDTGELPGDRALYAMRIHDTPRLERSLTMIVRGEHKLIADRTAGSWELYDIDRDPREEQDLSAVDAGRTRELASLLSAWETRPPRFPRSFAEEIELDTERIDSLRALGYAGEEEER